MESIGRIVSEGESREASPEDIAPPEAAPAASAAKDENDDDILDLVDVVDEQGNVIHLDRARGGAPATSSIPSAGHATEAQVLEALKPMLQTWLDTHMPPIVERLVKRELERDAPPSEPE